MWLLFARRYCPKLKSPKPPLVAFKFPLPFLVAVFSTPSPRLKKQKTGKKKQVVLYRINILLFNKDIYVIRNFALGRCWPEKSRFLWLHAGLSWSSEPAVEGSGCDFDHWRVGSVVWKGCSLCNLDLCGVVLSTCFRCYLASSTSSPMHTLHVWH